MTVYLAHAPADREAAEALEKVIERRGQFVELDDGQTAMRPVEPSDVFVLFVSQALLFATARLRLEQRALDAWSEGRLLLVKLDEGVPPVGLRDLPAIDASSEAQREFRWNEVADAIRDKLSGAPAAQDAAPAARPKGGASSWAAHGLAVLLGLFALVVIFSIFLTTRIGPSPGGIDELRQGVDAFGVRYGLPSGVAEWLFAAAIVAMLLAIVSGMMGLLRRKPGMRGESGAPQASAPQPKPTDAMFVTYAQANETVVLPMIEAATKAGRKFWLAQQGIPGDGWAGEMVRAIRGAGGVVVMCSKAAFESDHVKREIYLADRYRKKLVPVFIEQAETPEDFDYFFAGAQALKLFETPVADRSQALVRVLG